MRGLTLILGVLLFIPVYAETIPATGPLGYDWKPPIETCFSDAFSIYGPRGCVTNPTDDPSSVVRAWAARNGEGCSLTVNGPWTWYDAHTRYLWPIAMDSIPPKGCWLAGSSAVNYGPMQCPPGYRWMSDDPAYTPPVVCRSNDMVNTCPPNQNWTYSNGQCTRPDCDPLTQIRDEATGQCKARGCVSGQTKDPADARAASCRRRARISARKCVQQKR